MTPYSVYAYNNSKHITTLLKPIYTLFGVEPDLTIDTIFRNFDPTENTRKKIIGEYIAKLRAN